VTRRAETNRFPPYAFMLSDSIVRRSALLSLTVPAFFIFLKAFGISLVTSQQAELIMRTASVLWPVAREHYDAVLQLARLQDANNLTLFYAIMLAFFVSLSAYVVARAAVDTNKIGEVGRTELIILVISVPLIVFGCVYDRVDNDSLFSLRFDNVGFYYVRQWAVIHTVRALFATLLVCLVVLTSRLRAHN
jgi:hypothetical protein